MNNEMIDRAFDKWWKHEDETHFQYKHDCEVSFKAAFTLLYPLLEKSLEALEWYHDNVTMDDLHCEKINGMPTDKVARSTIQEIEAALKEMGEMSVCICRDTEICIYCVKKSLEAKNNELNRKLEDAYKDGVRACIMSLRNLQEESFHERKWNFSGKTKFAPVELSDYLLINVLRESTHGESK